VVGEGSIEEALRLPRKLEPGRYEVHCKVVINTSGAASYTRCYSTSDWAAPENLRKAVLYAANISRFIPAVRDGEPAEVYATLMVIVDTRLDGDPLILAVPNNGVEVARYGLLYTAPQRYGDIYVGGRNIGRHVARTSVVWMEMQVDELGKTKDYRLTEEPRAPQSWVQAIRAAMQRFTYLPAYHQGKPVPARHVEAMIWQG
jgi:hypothetical protein